jgi:hypothetical protein
VQTSENEGIGVLEKMKNTLDDGPMCRRRRMKKLTNFVDGV